MFDCYDRFYCLDTKRGGLLRKRIDTPCVIYAYGDEVTKGCPGRRMIKMGVIWRLYISRSDSPFTSVVDLDVSGERRGL